MEEGKKYDSGKSMIGTAIRIFAEALLGVGKCIEFGTHKYPDPSNWKHVGGGIDRYQDAMQRHLALYNSGQEFDEETGLPHLYHMCWNALAITEFYTMTNGELTL